MKRASRRQVIGGRLAADELLGVIAESPARVSPTTRVRGAEGEKYEKPQFSEE
jgi:hypothetical protein